jgi:hypothetical protein
MAAVLDEFPQSLSPSRSPIAMPTLRVLYFMKFSRLSTYRLALVVLESIFDPNQV